MSAEGRFEVRSNEAGAFLVIEHEGSPGPHAELGDGYWTASLSCGSMQGSLRFYEIGLGALDEFFAGLASDWRGWKGERSWVSLEDAVELEASHDGLGTVTLKVRLRTEAFAVHRWSASAELMLDAGGLDRLAREARLLVSRR
jgi:hypothetical protein